MRTGNRTALLALRFAEAAELERLEAVRRELRELRLLLRWRREMKYSPEQPRDADGRWVPWEHGEGSEEEPPVDLVANDGTPGNNQAQNKQVNDVVRQLKLTKDERQQLHREISGLNLGFQEILQIGREIKGK
jgi:hypothetical protein